MYDLTFTLSLLHCFDLTSHWYHHKFKSVLWIFPFYYVHIVPNAKTKNTEIHLVGALLRA